MANDVETISYINFGDGENHPIDAVTVNGQTLPESSKFLPEPTNSDEGKVLKVVNGAWTVVSPVHIFSGEGLPSDDYGNNGDFFIQAEDTRLDSYLSIEFGEIDGSEPYLDVTINCDENIDGNLPKIALKIGDYYLDANGDWNENMCVDYYVTEGQVSIYVPTPYSDPNSPLVDGAEITAYFIGDEDYKPALTSTTY